MAIKIHNYIQELEELLMRWGKKQIVLLLALLVLSTMGFYLKLQDFSI